MEQYQKSFIMEQKKENGMVQNADEQKEEKPKKENLSAIWRKIRILGD